VADILNQITTMAKACPNQKYVLGGHSQGGVVTVRAIPSIPKELLPRILAVTMFGSPNCPALVKDRCRSYCNKGDGVSYHEARKRQTKSPDLHRNRRRQVQGPLHQPEAQDPRHDGGAG
jgi:alpha-beta hydrolase superfamily lysophospholipase